MPELRIFDVHQHLPEHIPNIQTEQALIQRDLDYRLRVMDKHRIQAGAIMASLLYDRPNGVADTRRMNDYVAWYRDRHRDRFPVGIGTVEPIHGLEQGLLEINRIATELKLDGLVWHNHFAGMALDHYRMVAFVNALGDLGLPAFVHVREPYEHETPTRLENLAQRAPATAIVAMGVMTGAQRLGELHGVGERCPNVVFETSLVWPLNNWIDRFVEFFGSQRVIFGTDLHYHEAPSYRHPPGLADVLESDKLTDDDRENILWANAARLFPLPLYT